MRRAVIDIGTNTVKLLVADVVDGVILPIAHRDVTTRMGEGVQQTNRLTAVAIARTAAAIAGYVAEAHALGAADVIALTTSATRSATNAAEFLSACPVPVEVVTGEREAELVFRGAASDPVWAGDRLLVMDVGGGSAEWIVGQAGKVGRALSLPVGAVRLHEQFGEDFAGLMAHLRAELGRALPPFRARPWRLIGTGGTLLTLAHLAQMPVDHARLTLDALRELVTHLNALPLAERRRVPGLPPERADIIVAGGAVFLAALETLGAAEITVSVRALRFGALLEER